MLSHAFFDEFKSMAADFEALCAGASSIEGRERLALEIEVPERYTHMNIDSRGEQHSKFAIHEIARHIFAN